VRQFGQRDRRIGAIAARRGTGMIVFAEHAPPAAAGAGDAGHGRDGDLFPSSTGP